MSEQEIKEEIEDIDEDLTILKDMMYSQREGKERKPFMDKINKKLDKRLKLMAIRDGE